MWQHDAVPVNTHNLTLAHYRVPRCSVVVSKKWPRNLCSARGTTFELSNFLPLDSYIIITFFLLLLLCLVNCIYNLPFHFNHLDDISFSLAIYELSHGPINCNSDCLDTLLFNPIKQPELCNPLSSYLDPDSNFATCPLPSKYVVEEELNNEMDTANNTVNFSIMHLNARSLLGNFDKVYLLLNNICKLFSIICVSETWLNDATSELVNITGYNFVSSHRKSKSGRGVSINLQSDLDYKLCPECNF